MGVPSDQLMNMIKSQQDSATPGGLPPAPEMGGEISGTSAPPMSSPMSTPEPKMGNREAAMINLSMAQDLIEQALPAIGSDSPEGRSALAAISAINKVIGAKKAKTNELQPAEILQMLQNLPQAGGASPETKAMAGAPAIPGMGATPPAPPPMPAGGGMPPPPAPGGAPGGAPMPPTPPM